MKLSELPRLLETSGFANRTEGQEAPDLIGVNTLRNANKGALSFLTTSQYREPMRNARASAAVVERAGPAPEDWPARRCTNPHGAVAAAIKRIHGSRIQTAWGRDRRAIVAESARIGSGAHGGPAQLTGK